MPTSSGSGKILKDGQYICKAIYQLHQEGKASDQIRTSGEITLTRETERASIDVRDLLGSGQALTLKLTDNSDILIFLNPLEPLAGQWRIVGTPATNPIDAHPHRAT